MYLGSMQTKTASAASAAVSYIVTSIHTLLRASTACLLKVLQIIRYT